MENLREDYRARVREDLLTEAASDTNKVKFFQEQFQVSQGGRFIVRDTWIRDDYNFGNTLIDRTRSLSSVSDGTLSLESRSQFCESELLINICSGII